MATKLQEIIPVAFKTY